jgi:anti-anti-sigma factor
VTEPTVVEVVGELDLSTVAYWEATVDRAARTTELVVLDVSRVEFLDSAGVHALFRMLTTLRNQRKRLVIVAPQDGRVRRLIEILDLPSLTWVCETVEEALAGSAGPREPNDEKPNGDPARLPIGRTGT